MYADDTVLLAESPEELHTSLNTMKDYCSMFDLEINMDKTKGNYENPTILITGIKRLKL